MSNYRAERHNKWLYHSVIKWKGAFLILIKMITYLTLTLLVFVTSVTCKPSLHENNLSKRSQSVSTLFSNQDTKGIQILSNSSTELDCKDWKENCSWFWDKDNFTSSRIKDLPGQHGFFSTDSKYLRKVNDGMSVGQSGFSFPNSKKKKSGK